LQNDLTTQENKSPDQKTVYLYFDGLCEPKNPGGVATYGVAVWKGSEMIFEESGLARAKPWSNDASNNVAEYSAILRGLEWLLDHGYSNSKVVVRGDSRIVINQLNGTFKIKAPRLLELYHDAKALLTKFQNLKIEWVDRSRNSEADLLSRIAYKKYRREHQAFNPPGSC
jgi:ribonuclease HI